MLEAELLFTEIFKCSRLSLYLNRESHIDRESCAVISRVLNRRIRGEPIQYILGKTEFFGLELEVNRDVFIPRQETEILVEAVLKKVSPLASACPCPSGRRAAGRRLPVCPLRILDVGTGSGCIAISLAKSLPAVKIDALDISQQALDIAEENARRHNLDINFIHSDLFSSGALPLAGYDYIVSNPPYIATSGIAALDPEIQYEPVIALDGREDGLDYYRRIINHAARYLKDEGLLILEIGFNQRGGIENIFQKSGNFEIIEVTRDYNNIDRVIVAQLNNQGSG